MRLRTGILKSSSPAVGGMRVVVCLVLALGLLAPAARAEESRGQLQVQGSFALAERAETVLSPQLVMSNTTWAVDGFELQAAKVVVHLYSGDAVSVRDPIRDHTHLPHTVRAETHTYHNVSIRLEDASAEGLWVLNSTDGRLTLPSAGALTFEPRPYSDMTDVPGSPPWASDHREHHHRQIFRTPHLATHAQGVVQYEGGGSIKLHGMMLYVESDEGGRLISTQWTTTSGPGPLEKMRWAVLEFPHAVLQASAQSPWRVLASDVTFVCGGLSLFGPTSGTLEANGFRLLAEGRATHLSGELKGRATPMMVDEAAVVALDLAGDLQHTDLVEEPAGTFGRASVPAPIGGWLLLPLALALVAGGFAVGLAVRRRRGALAAPAAIPLTPEDCCALAARAIDHERWPEAAEWLSRARRLAPGSARLCADLAYATAQMGEHEEALALFVEARGLGADAPEMHFHAALAALAARRPPAEAEAWAKAALEHSPSLALEMEERPFDALRGRPGFEEALTRAWDRLAGEAPPPSKPF